MNRSMCQACLTSPVEREVAGEVADYPYLLCNACAERLENRALRPLEWYRLAVLHGPLTYLLHDDFYDQDGTADQNRVPVKQASLFPAPKLADVENDLAALLDFAMTRWHLSNDVSAALRTHDADAVLAHVSALVDSRQRPWEEARSYEIAADVLGSKAEEWVRSRWASGSRPPLLHSFMRAAAACMPHNEAIPMALAAVEQSGMSDLSVPALSLAHFRSPKVIDWIDGMATSPISNRWGLLAARSGLSWATATKWLDKGRPMSLVAMDAMGVIMRPEHGERPSMFDMTMDDAPPNDMILARLREYALRDPVPRVTQMIDRIVAASAKADSVIRPQRS